MNSVYGRRVDVAGHFDPKVNSLIVQTRSVCFNPGQFVAGTKHRSPVVFLPIAGVPGERP